MAGKRKAEALDSGPAGRVVSVIAQDPSVKDSKGNILMSRIRIPREIVRPGPAGYRVQVVDFDATEGAFHSAHELPQRLQDEPAAWRHGTSRILADYRFHAQNVYALVMKTLIYHQMRSRWPRDCPYCLNGEIDKAAHPILTQLGVRRAIPDL